MKVVVLLSVVVAVSSELPPTPFNRFPSQSFHRRPPQSFHRRPSQSFQRPSFGGGFPSPPRPAPRPIPSNVPVDETLDRSQYYFSWRHDNGRKYTGDQAHSVCTRLGGGWQPIGISSREEIELVIRAVGRDNVEYIWTGGVRSGRGFVWLNGEPFTVDDWSHTGGFRIPQPDNREDGIENCLSVLNNFYGDGIKWHDVACHHLKPVICEKHI
ncbi:macrophage mannose receptor 1-like [Procambarus clarkii]|uniref:macrophage mannose receptor 1-like n=1 Tax=Procambarus clarkii TaxID=6728 RepID=UPI001E675AA5|nr:pulmonary surfactant-associated protein D-like [Procambarus clarkii]